MTDTTHLEAKVLLLEHDAQQCKVLTDFCDSVGLMPLLRTSHDALTCLEQHKDLAGVLLAEDLPCGNRDALHLAEPDKVGLKTFYETYGFKGLARAIGEGGDAQPSASAGASSKPKFEPNPGLFDEPEPSVSQVSDKTYDCVLTWEAFDAWLAKLQAAELVAFDTETTSLDAMRAEIDVAHIGFDIPDEFVVGYGLDFDERYRDLPYIGTLDPKVYEQS